jgi:GTP:adenosylcobinamide-phosphate guanylyltransferase
MAHARGTRPAPDGAAPDAVLVLAGRRGERDPVAAVAGVSHKALVRVAGAPMLERVLESLRAALPHATLHVSCGDAALLRETGVLGRLVEAGVIRHHPSAGSPAASVAAFLESGPEAPLLVTTADHALLSREVVEHFVAAARSRDADVVVGLVERACFRERFPDVRRTFVPLRDGAFTGANLFLLRPPAAVRVVRFWTRAERQRKRPWRLVALFGATTLVRVLLGRLDLAGALARVSEVAGGAVEAVVLPFPESAIDVDTTADLEQAERLLGAQRSALDSSSKTRRTGS